MSEAIMELTEAECTLISGGDGGLGMGSGNATGLGFGSGNAYGGGVLGSGN
jgi:hypothetical protein